MDARRVLSVYNIMKIIKYYRFPSLSHPSRPSANQTHLLSPLEGDLLIGIKVYDKKQLKSCKQDDDERTAEEEDVKEDVNAIPKWKNRRIKSSQGSRAEIATLCK